MSCNAHSEAETTLRCGKCGKLICPKCMVQTPVGARCAECARVYRIPTYRVSRWYYLRGIAAGLCTAGLSAFIWSLIDHMVPFLYLDLILAGAVGYALAEIIGLATNRKRGAGLAIVGCICFAFAYAVKALFFGNIYLSALNILFALGALAIGSITAINRLK